MTDFVKRLPSEAIQQVLSYVDFRTKVKLERVSSKWRTSIEKSYGANMKEVWIYTIFRKGKAPTHEEMRVRFSYHGPIFWERQVVYVYLCTCHFEQHEATYKALCQKLGPHVDRVCIVDSPINVPFLTDEFYRFLLDTMPNLKWMYLRELDLEPVSWSLTNAAADHPNLKKIIVHWCRNYDTLENFEVLKRRLLICNTPINGLKYLEDIEKQLQDMRIQDQKDEEEKTARQAAAKSDSQSQTSNARANFMMNGQQPIEYEEKMLDLPSTKPKLQSQSAQRNSNSNKSTSQLSTVRVFKNSTEGGLPTLEGGGVSRIYPEGQNDSDSLKTVEIHKTVIVNSQPAHSSVHCNLNKIKEETESALDEVVSTNQLRGPPRNIKGAGEANQERGGHENGGSSKNEESCSMNGQKDVGTKGLKLGLNNNENEMGGESSVDLNEGRKIDGQLTAAANVPGYGVSNSPLP